MGTTAQQSTTGVQGGAALPVHVTNDQINIQTPNAIVLPPIQPTTGPLVDRSGTIELGGVSQQVFPQNTARNYLLVQNLHQSRDLWVNFGAAASNGTGSIMLTPGGSFTQEGTFICQESVHLFATHTGHPYTIKEG